MGTLSHSGAVAGAFTRTTVLAEMFRVLAPGGRIGISDVVAEDHVTPAQRAERGSYAGCIAGALSRSEYLEGLTAAGFVNTSVEFTHEAAEGLHGTIIRATKPPTPTPTPSRPRAELTFVGDADGACCSTDAQASCCAPNAKAECCGGSHPAGSCGCQ